MRLKVYIIWLLFIPLLGEAQVNESVYKIVDGSDEILKKLGLPDSIFCLVNIHCPGKTADSVITLKANITNNGVTKEAVSCWGKAPIPYEVDYYDWDLDIYPTFNEDFFMQDFVFLKDAILAGNYRNECSFSGTKFMESVNFENSLFSKGFFGNITCSGEANFSNAGFCTFPGTKADFKNSTFYGYTRFANSTFHTGADLSECTFKNECNFNETIFDSLADFSGCHFEDTTYMNRVVFVKDAFFSKSVFKHYLTLESGKLFGKTDFTNCSFDSVHFDMGQIDITGKVSFYNATPPVLINLKYASINGLVDLSQMNIDTIFYLGKINIAGADIENIKFIYGIFTLELDSTTRSSLSLKSSMLTALLSNQNKFGFVDGSKKADIELQQLKYQIEDHSIISFTRKWWSNYGHNREYIWAWISGFLLLFTLINWVINPDKLNRKVYPVNWIKHIWPRSKLYKSFIYTAAIFFGFKVDIDRFKTLTFFAFWILIIHATGLVTMAVFLGYLIQP